MIKFWPLLKILESNYYSPFKNNDLFLHSVFLGYSLYPNNGYEITPHFNISFSDEKLIIYMKYDDNGLILASAYITAFLYNHNLPFCDAICYNQSGQLFCSKSFTPNSLHPRILIFLEKGNGSLTLQYLFSKEGVMIYTFNKNGLIILRSKKNLK